MLWTCRASTDRQLTTTGALLTELYGSTVAATSEYARLDALITRASQWAETFVGYPLTVQIYGETVPGYGGRTLRLSRTPIRGLARVFNSTSTSSATDYSTQVRIEDADAGLLSLDAGFPWTPMVEQHLAEHPVAGQESRPWFVTYEAGYCLDGIVSTEGGTTSTGRTLPADIEQAVIGKGTGYREGTDNVVSKRVGDLSITYASGSEAGNIPGGAGAAEILLAPYRRVV